MASSLASTSRTVLRGVLSGGGGATRGVTTALRASRAYATDPSSAAPTTLDADPSEQLGLAQQPQEGNELQSGEAAAVQPNSIAARAAPRNIDADIDPELLRSAAEREKRRMRKTMVSHLSCLGSSQSRKSASASDPNSYRPHQARIDPITARQTTVSHLIASTAHVGHSTSNLNRAAAGYVYGTRHGVAYIDVERFTLPALRRAAEVVKDVVMRDGAVLFLGTAPGTQDAVLAAAKRLGPNGFHVTKERWMPGVLSNAPKLLTKAIMGGMEHYEAELRSQRGGGDRRRAGGGGSGPDPSLLASQTLQPDLMIVLNPKANLHAIREATDKGIPTIGITDTDVDPRVVTYAIPANDESIRTAELIVGALSKAGEEGARERRRRIEEEEKAASNLRFQRGRNAAAARLQEMSA